LQFVLVQEVVRALALAEQQPGAPLDAERCALLQEGAEWRDAGAGAAHDDPRARLRGKAEMAGLDAGADRPEAGGAIGQEAARDTMTETASPRLAHDGDT